jgi:hypothetical protein
MQIISYLKLSVIFSINNNDFGMYLDKGGEAPSVLRTSPRGGEKEGRWKFEDRRWKKEQERGRLEEIEKKYINQ